MENKEKKSFKFYWGILNLPLLLLVVCLGLSAILGMALNLQTNIFLSIASWVLVVAILGFNGFRVTRKVNDEEGKHGALSGLLLGVFGGFIAAIISLVLSLLNPGMIAALVDMTMNQSEMMGQSVPRETIENMMQIGLYTSLLTTPILYGIIGAAISAVAALIFRKK